MPRLRKAVNFISEWTWVASWVRFNLLYSSCLRVCSCVLSIERLKSSAKAEYVPDARVERSRLALHRWGRAWMWRRVWQRTTQILASWKSSQRSAKAGRREAAALFALTLIEHGHDGGVKHVFDVFLKFPYLNKCVVYSVASFNNGCVSALIERANSDGPVYRRCIRHSTLPQSSAPFARPRQSLLISFSTVHARHFWGRREWMGLWARVLSVRAASVLWRFESWLGQSDWSRQGRCLTGGTRGVGWRWIVPDLEI